MKPKFTPQNVPPGRYMRHSPSYSVMVDVFRQGNVLRERTVATGVFGEPRDNPGATYESVEVTA